MGKRECGSVSKNILTVYLHNAKTEIVDGREVIDTTKYPGSLGVTLELCAGIVDKYASLEEIARAEALEECGYDVPLECLRKITSFRNGVGASGCLTTLFYAEVKDEMKVGEGGGLAHEGELIEVVELAPEESRKLIYDESVHREAGLLFGLSWFFDKILPPLHENQRPLEQNNRKKKKQNSDKIVS